MQKLFDRTELKQKQKQNLTISQPKHEVCLSFYQTAKNKFNLIMSSIYQFYLLQIDQIISEVLAHNTCFLFNGITHPAIPGANITSLGKPPRAAKLCCVQSALHRPVVGTAQPLGQQGHGKRGELLFMIPSLSFHVSIRSILCSTRTGMHMEKKPEVKLLK